jgi:hypothetical protein
MFAATQTQGEVWHTQGRQSSGLQANVRRSDRNGGECSHGTRTLRHRDYPWVDEFETNLLNTPLGHLDDREDLTASLGYVGDRWSVVAFGRNPTDEEFEIFTPIATLFAVGTVSRPRTFGIEFEYDFSLQWHACHATMTMRRPLRQERPPPTTTQRFATGDFTWPEPPTTRWSRSIPSQTPRSTRS